MYTKIFPSILSFLALFLWTSQSFALFFSTGWVKCLPFFDHRLRNTSTNRFHYNTYTADLPSCTHHNHYAFSVSNMPLRKPVKNVGKSCILQNFSVICPKPYNLQLILTSHQQKMASMQRQRQRHVYFTITISSGVRFCHPVKIKQSRRWNHAQWNEELVALF